MQNKKPLRYVSPSHAVYREVEAHFVRNKIELPSEWESLVAIACFPGQVVEQPNWTSDDPEKHPVKANFRVTPLEKEVRAFQACFARVPDLTLEILTLARQCLASFDEKKCNSQDSRVRAFFIKFGHSTVISDNGKLRLPQKNEFAGWTMAELQRGKRNGLKLVSVARLQDGEIATLLTNHHLIDIKTASVTTARKAISFDYTAKRKPYYFAKELRKRKK